MVVLYAAFTCALVNDEVAIISGDTLCTVMLAEVCTPLFAAAVAVMTAVPVRVGAVKSPLGEIDPALADQLTEVCEVFLTMAVNWTLAPGAIWAVSGLSAIDTWLCTVPEETSSCSNCLPYPNWESVAATVKAKVPLTAGTPEIVPVLEFSDKPEGSAPCVIQNL